MRWIFVSLIWFCAAWSGAESWTNAAGHAIEAELVARKGDRLTLQRPNGSTFTISLTVLSPQSRATVEKKFPSSPILTHEEQVRQRTSQRLELLNAEQFTE